MHLGLRAKPTESCRERPVPSVGQGQQLPAPMPCSAQQNSPAISRAAAPKLPLPDVRARRWDGAGAAAPRGLLLNAVLLTALGRR